LALAFVLLGAVLAAVPAPALGGAPLPGIGLAPCQLAHPLTPARIAARCGTLEVPEDRARPGGRRIALAVAVIPADSPRAEPDPVYVLAGGPGQSIRQVFPVLAQAFGRVARSRDLVLVDQRGTGGSGRLACPSLESPERVLDDPAKELAAIAACARGLGVELARHGTDDYVADLEAVREALGHRRVNAIGFSYGTRVALAWARAHPARIRSLVLDGVVPSALAVGEQFEEDGQRALDRLFARCAGDPLCAARLPDPRGDLRRLRDRLQRQGSVEVRTRHPLTGAPLQARFGLEQLRAVVGAFLYQAETAAVLPVMLAAAASGDLGPLAAQGVAATAELEAGLSRPLQLSILCAEDVPLVDAGSPGQDAGLFLGRSVRDALRRSCAAWPVPRASPAWRAPWRSEVPALLLSGGADPATAPRWAERAAKELPNARHVVLEDQGHGVFARGCVPHLVAEFLDAGAASGLDLSCVRAIQPPPVFVDLLGGAP
jgi:pimeloyl-ACP methyl ester carboxylesterase